MIIALLLRISDQARRPLARPAPVPTTAADDEATQVVKLPMNKPIRTISIFCLLLFLALLLNATYLQYVEAGSLNSRARQPAGARRGVLPRARRDRRRRHVGRRERASPTTSTSTSASTRSRCKYAPLTGYFSYSTAAPASSRARTTILSGSDPRLFVNRVVDLLGNNASPRAAASR